MTRVAPRDALVAVLQIERRRLTITTFGPEEAGWIHAAFSDSSMPRKLGGRVAGAASYFGRTWLPRPVEGARR